MFGLGWNGCTLGSLRGTAQVGVNSLMLNPCVPGAVAPEPSVTSSLGATVVSSVRVACSPVAVARTVMRTSPASAGSAGRSGWPTDCMLCWVTTSSATRCPASDSARTWRSAGTTLSSGTAPRIWACPTSTLWPPR